VNHVDESIALLARTRNEQINLTQLLAHIGRLLRAGEWVNHESEVLGLPGKCQQLTEQNNQLTEETNQLRGQMAEQARELQSIKDSLAAKEKRGGWFGK
jgi:chromosome segregation ATPase